MKSTCKDCIYYEVNTSVAGFCMADPPLRTMSSRYAECRVKFDRKPCRFFTIDPEEYDYEDEKDKKTKPKDKKEKKHANKSK